jgi:hypothetical protein
VPLLGACGAVHEAAAGTLTLTLTRNGVGMLTTAECFACPCLARVARCMMASRSSTRPSLPGVRAGDGASRWNVSTATCETNP